MLPMKPRAPSQIDNARWEHTALRRRMQQGTWENDLEDELYRHLPTDRREAWGPADLSSNVFEQVNRQLSVLYTERPSIHNSQGNIEQLQDMLTLAGLFPLMQRMQQYTLGMRECIMRIDVNPNVDNISIDNSGLQYRIVTPDYVVCDASPDTPDIPNYYQELRLRNTPNGKPAWVYDCISIRDMNNPKFGMYEAKADGGLGQDVTKHYMGQSAYEGDAYPYRDKDGKPFLPLTMYHAEKTGLLWNSFDQSQLCYGSLSSAVFYSMFAHCLRDSSWPQRYAIGVTLSGLTALDQDATARRAGIATDPSSILMFQPTEDSQPQIGQFQPGADVQGMLEAIAKYEFRVATSSGVSPADLQKTSGDPRSGFAISVSRAAQRESQRKFAPVFRMADEELLTKSAMLSNRFLGTSLPEQGYRIAYKSLPLSPEETRANREDIIAKLQAGLISPIQAMQIMYPDLSEEQARAELIKIRRERAEFM